MLVFKLAAMAFLAAVLSLSLKKEQPAYAFLISLCGAAGLLLIYKNKRAGSYDAIPPAARLFVCKMRVDPIYKVVGVHAVYHTCLFQRFSPCGRASQAMHPHFQEKGRGCLVQVKNIAYDGLFCNLCHYFNLRNFIRGSVCFFTLL